MAYITVLRPSEHTGGGDSGFAQKDWAAAIAGQNAKCSNDSLVNCIFPGGHWAGKTAELVKAATGWTDYTEDDLVKLGAREFALARLFEMETQQLKDPKKEWDNIYPKRWFEDPLPNGPMKGKKSHDGDEKQFFDVELPAYWKARGWTEDKGIPTLETLKALGIDDIAGDIAKKYL